MDIKTALKHVSVIVVEKVVQFLTDPDEFWGIERTPTMENQILEGISRSDEELDALSVQQCGCCGRI